MKKDETKITGTVNTQIAPKKVERSLRYDFTEEELQKLGGDLARTVEDRQKIENEKKSVASQFKRRLDGKQADIELMSSHINNGFEYRETRCKLRFNDPVIGKKSVYRLDNGALVETENMTESELQLKIDLDNENSEFIDKEQEVAL